MRRNIGDESRDILTRLTGLSLATAVSWLSRDNRWVEEVVPFFKINALSSAVAVAVAVG